MQITHRFREIGIVCLLCLLLLFPSSILFFIDGGQIIGINENLEKKQNIVGQTVDNVLVTPAHGVIKPIDDGTEIVSVNLWQLPPRDILIRIITKPMAYIPPLILTFAFNYLSGSRFVFVCSLSSKGSENRTCSGLPL